MRSNWIACMVAAQTVALVDAKIAKDASRFSLDSLKQASWKENSHKLNSVWSDFVHHKTEEAEPVPKTVRT